jgi:hypothetical protein
VHDNPDPSFNPPNYHLGIYSEGALAAAVRLSGSAEAFVEMRMNLDVWPDRYWYVASTIGMRYVLP